MSEQRLLPVVLANSKSCFEGPMIIVVVGESTKKPSRPFFVHAGFLTSRFTFFATALKNYGKADHGEPEGAAEQTVEDQSI
jgi:hypothetical protein